jgi:predicted ATPase
MPSEVWRRQAMLEALSIQNFKSLVDVGKLELPRMAVLFGPNAAGKSNFLDAILALSRIGTCRTIGEALQEPLRGHPIEAFTFPSGGLPELLAQSAPEFKLEATLKIGRDRYQYRLAVRIHPESGSTTVGDEYLAALTARDTVKGNPSIECVDQELRIRRKGKAAPPRKEPFGLNHSILSDPSLSGTGYRALEKCRNELSGWRTYYLDPRVAMRRTAPPAEVRDIGVLGEDIAPFLYRLSAEHPRHFEAVERTLRTIITSIDGLTVDLDKRRGTLDILVRQNGIDFSSRIVSEGTLRVLALCAVVVNPHGGSLLAFEEPENGVHPRRLELIADLLSGLCLEPRRQLIVTTHSPLFCARILEKARQYPEEIGLFNVRQTDRGTSINRFETFGPLFQETEIATALSSRDEDGLFEGLMLRGILDE